jgi:release factor glutamine methyltransferase
VRWLLRQGLAQLREAGVPSHTLAAELLLAHALGCDRASFYAHPDSVASEGEERRFFDLVVRRTAGEPTQHLIGKQEFWGLEFEVTPDVLIPRPETEHVVEVVLERLARRGVHVAHPQNAGEDGPLIADVGTGSGCIAIALATELPRAMICATEVSLPALDVARRNAIRLGVAGRVQFVACDLLDAFLRGSRAANQRAHLFDLIVSNPPYIGLCEKDVLPREVREHEPEIALFAGETGAEVYPALITQAAGCLKSQGILVLELGHNSLAAVRLLLGSAPWINVSVANDLAGIPRVIGAERL